MAAKRRERIESDPGGAGLELTRLRTALETLATGDEGDDVITVFEFVRSMLEDSSTCRGFRQWLDGDLGVELERRPAGGTSLRVVADTHRRLLEVFVVPFARLPFPEVVNIAERVPGLLGASFILIERDVVSVSLVRYIEGVEPAEEETSPRHDLSSLVENAFDDDRDTDPTREVRRSGIMSSGEADTPYDPERTVIAPPSTDLIRRSRR